MQIWTGGKRGAAAPALYVNIAARSRHSRREVGLTQLTSLELFNFSMQQWQICRIPIGPEARAVWPWDYLPAEPSSFELIELPHIPLFLWLWTFQDAFWMSVLRIETGSPKGLLGGYRGLVRRSGRNCQSISFLRPWETAPQVFFAYF